MSSYGPYGQPPGPGQGQPQGQPFGRPQPASYGQPGQPPYGQQPPHGPQPGYGQPPPSGWGQPPQQGWGQPTASAAPPRPAPTPRPGQRPTALPVVTMELVPGREIATVLGPVVGVVARARELPPQARTGSMTDAYAAMLVTSRQDAVDQVVAMARAAGADAVVGLRFDSSEITQSLSEVTAYGTAVTLTPDSDASAADNQAGSAATDSPATPASANPWRPVADQSGRPPT